LWVDLFAVFNVKVFEWMEYFVVTCKLLKDMQIFQMWRMGFLDYHAYVVCTLVLFMCL
jgi:hypothetical protein